MSNEDPDDVRQRAKSHAEHHRARGLKRISAWVPTKDTDRLQKIARQLRADANLSLESDERIPPKKIEIPIIPVEPVPTVFVRIGPEELGMHMLLRANGGQWRGQRKLWEVPATLPTRLGIAGRQVASQSKSQKSTRKK